MTPDELLRVYPRETLRWLRGRLGLTQEALAFEVEVEIGTVAGWEIRRHGIARHNRERLVALLAPHLATPEGEAFLQSLRRGAATEEDRA